MAVCPTCGRWLVSRDLVPVSDVPDVPRDRCPYDGAPADMDAPVPAGGGPLLGITPTPPPKLTPRDWVELPVFLGYLGFMVLTPVLLLPLLALAALLAWLTGNLVFIVAWVVVAVVWLVMARFLPVNN